MDRETEKRVWQRVLAQGQDSGPGELARLLRLSRMQAGELKLLDRELARREQVTLGLLTGLYELSVGGPLPAEIPVPAAIPMRERLRRCLERCREMLMLCIGLEKHPRYGPVFTDLTRQLRACCAQLDQRAGDRGTHI